MLAKEQVLEYSQSNYKRIELMCEELAKYLSQQYSRKILGTYSGDGVEDYYNEIPFEEQNAIFKNLLNYYSLIVDAVSKDIDLTDPSIALKHSLKWNGHSTYDEIFKTIGRDDVVEMFDLEFRQIWRSNNFFKYSSHSLSALFCKPFPMNFKKEPAVVESHINTAAMKLLNQEVDFLHDVTETHLITEVGATTPIVTKGNVKYASLLIKGESPAGLVSVMNVLKECTLSTV